MKKIFLWAILILLNMGINSCSFFPGYFQSWYNASAASGEWEDLGFQKPESIYYKFEVSLQDNGDIILGHINAVQSGVFVSTYKGNNWSYLGVPYPSPTFLALGLSVGYDGDQPVVVSKYEVPEPIYVHRWDQGLPGWAQEYGGASGYWENVKLVQTETGLGLVVSSNSAGSEMWYYPQYNSAVHDTTTTTIIYQKLAVNHNKDYPGSGGIGVALIDSSSVELYTNVFTMWGSLYTANPPTSTPETTDSKYIASSNGFWTNYISYIENAMMYPEILRIWNDTLFTTTQQVVHSFFGKTSVSYMSMDYDFGRDRIYVAMSSYNLTNSQELVEVFMVDDKQVTTVRQLGPGIVVPSLVTGLQLKAVNGVVVLVIQDDTGNLSIYRNHDNF